MYAPVARLEAIRLLLVFAYYINFKLYQMDVKNIFLNNYIIERIFVEQPHKFENQALSNHVFKLNKTFYGLKQAPRAWYDRLNKFLLENKFIKVSVDTTLFLKGKEKNLLVVQIYVDDIIFGASNENLYQKFA